MIHVKDGDWKKCEKLTKEAILIAENMDKIAQSLFELDAILRTKLQAAYEAAPKVDEHFANSVISSTRQTHYLKAYLRKLGFDAFKDIITAPHLIKAFGDEIKEACDWLLKLRHEAPTKLTK